MVGLGKRIGGRPAELVAAELQARTAAQLFQTLGELKGGAMKFGQALSAMEAAMPAEIATPYVEALTRLQEAAPPMPTTTLRKVLAGELGSAWRSEFVDFDEHPTAAASIGQVHRATRRDGTVVAVKVQYPGAADALRADVRQLDRLLPLARLGAPGIDMRQLFRQLRERLFDELDYEREAIAQSAFAEGFAGDPDITVPRVIAATTRVLISEWVDGLPLADVITDGSPGARDAAGLRLLRLFLSSPQRAGRIHGDPHPGNFRVLADGRLAVLDFGSTEVLAGWPSSLQTLLRAARDSDADALHHSFVTAGLIEPGDVEAARLDSVLSPWMEPLRADTFAFERLWLQRHVRSWSDPRGAGARLQRRIHLPSRYLLVQRAAFGLLGVLTSLNANVAVRREVDTWVLDTR